MIHYVTLLNRQLTIIAVITRQLLEIVPRQNKQNLTQSIIKIK